MLNKETIEQCKNGLAKWLAISVEEAESLLSEPGFPLDWESRERGGAPILYRNQLAEWLRENHPELAHMA